MAGEWIHVCTNERCDNEESWCLPEPGGVCPRCGRFAMWAGVEVALDVLADRLSPPPVVENPPV